MQRVGGEGDGPCPLELPAEGGKNHHCPPSLHWECVTDQRCTQALRVSDRHQQGQSRVSPLWEASARMAKVWGSSLGRRDFLPCTSECPWTVFECAFKELCTSGARVAVQSDWGLCPAAVPLALPEGPAPFRGLCPWHVGGHILTMFSHGLPSVPVCVLISPSYKRHQSHCVRTHPITSFCFNCVCKDPSPNTVSLRYEELGLERGKALSSSGLKAVQPQAAHLITVMECLWASGAIGSCCSLRIWQGGRGRCVAIRETLFLFVRQNYRHSSILFCHFEGLHGILLRWRLLP